MSNSIKIIKIFQQYLNMSGYELSENEVAKVFLALKYRYDRGMSLPRSVTITLDNGANTEIITSDYRLYKNNMFLYFIVLYSDDNNL